MFISWLEISAPFAAFRYFQAGVYRASSPIIPHSAAWGLVLNLAGIEIRTNTDRPTTEIDPNAPKIQLAVGAIRHAEKSSLYQQLHSYPVGPSGKDFKERTKGNKYWIAPVRREILVGLEAVIGVKTNNSEVHHRLADGVKGKLKVERYGLPFAGDNNLLFDKINLLEKPKRCFWYSLVDSSAQSRPNSCRLSVKIDRADSSKSVSLLFAPGVEASDIVPDEAWIWTPDEPS
ncbi:MAG: type I-MYXAN CRISPR-associated protein Cas5/Cmx5/DevS [Cryomorphaceae bacterium]|nr:type I-MYXAN CRISPR-associated protein Cas5/Cmx5/DevS [Cryomorphaceae bacterium]